MSDPHDPLSNSHTIGRDVFPSSVLDDDRVASMADEGGVSGALMEIDDTGERQRLIAKQRRRRGFSQWRTAAAVFAVLGMGVFAWGWFKRIA
jgi:hypothetical protein